MIMKQYNINELLPANYNPRKELTPDELKTDNFDLDITGFDADELDDTFDLKDGDRTPIQTISLTFSDDQAEIINEAIDKMKQTDTYKNYEDPINENSNGNALYLVVLEWIQLNK